MKKKLYISLIILLATIQCSALAFDGGGYANTHEMQKIQENTFERTAPQKIQESYEAKEQEKEADSEAQKQIDSKIQDIDREEKSFSGTVSNSQIYVVVKKVEFPKSAVFTEEELQKFAAPLLNKTVTIDEINKVVEEISKAYVNADYFTSRAYIPEQNVNDGVLRISLFEGRVGKISVTNNNWTRTSYITKRLDTQEGELFKLRALEKQVIDFNNKNDVKLSVKIQPGEEVGTTDVEIKTDNKLPFHITGVFDNQGRYNTGELRGGAIISSDTVFGIRDKIAAGGYFGSHSQVAFADYNLPVNKRGTRVGANFSFNHVKIANGPYKNYDFNGSTFAYGLYANHPLIDKTTTKLNSYSALNAKFTDTKAGSYKLYDTKSFSFTQGVNGRWDTKRGIWLTGQYVDLGYFDSQGTQKFFFKYEGNGTRLHDFGHGIIGEFRLAGQWSPTKGLPWIEQYQTGGMSSIRGYAEGTLIGKSGLNGTAEIITPIPFLPKKLGTEKIGYINPRDIIKFAVFVDQGAIFADDTGVLPSIQYLVSTGAGLRINVTNELLARVYWGFGFINTAYETDHKPCRFHFELSARPDLTRLVRLRNKKKETL